MFTLEAIYVQQQCDRPSWKTRSVIPADWCLWSYSQPRWDLVCRVPLWRVHRIWSIRPSADYWPLRLRFGGRVVWISVAAQRWLDREASKR